MAEVSKRDSQEKAMRKLGAFVDQITAKTLRADIAIRRAELEKCWTKFEVLHEQVMDRAGITEHKEQEDIFDEAREFYFKIGAKMDAAMLKDVQEPKSSSSKAKVVVSDTLSPTAAQRQSAVAKLILDTTLIVGRTVTLGQEGAINSLSKNLEGLFEQFQRIVLERIALGENEIEIMASQSHVHTTYLSAIAKLHTASATLLRGQNAADGVTESLDIKVPTLHINTFDGSLDKWEAFRESFTQGFHLRMHMPAVQKLQHLKGFLRGEAEELVQNFTLTNANYDTAWKLLNDRYDNKRGLVQSHIRTLANLPACRESSEDLRRLLNKTSSAVLALNNLGRPTEQWDDWIVFHVMEKFDHESRKLWEQSQPDVSVMATWANLEQFLQGRVRSLGSIGMQLPVQSNFASHTQKSKKVKAHHSRGKATPQASSDGRIIPRFDCPCCAQSHTIHFCHEFRNLDVIQRRDVVAKKGLCFVCLGSGHMAQSCDSNRKCRFCDKLHNSLLHAADPGLPIMTLSR